MAIIMPFMDYGTGRLWTVRWVETGDSYGLKDCLVHDSAQPMVEFYDTTVDMKVFGPRGQFVSRYDADTLLSVDGGLNLHGGVPVWTVSASGMERVQDFIRRRLAGKETL